MREYIRGGRDGAELASGAGINHLIHKDADVWGTKDTAAVLTFWGTGVKLGTVVSPIQEAVGWGALPMVLYSWVRRRSSQFSPVFGNRNKGSVMVGGGGVRSEGDRGPCSGREWTEAGP